jgi:hypothetical protein
MSWFDHGGGTGCATVSEAPELVAVPNALLTITL